MRIFLKVLKVLAVVLLALLLIGAAFYYFGSFKYFEPDEITFNDGKKMEVEISSGWCGVLPSMLGIKDIPHNTLFIKRSGCKVREIAKPVKLSHLVQIKGSLMTEAGEEQQILGMCAAGAYGLTGYQKDGVIYCVSAKSKDNIRGVTAFKKIGEDRMVATSYFLLPEIDRDDQLKELEKLVNSYKLVTTK